MRRTIYLDNHATTRVDDRVVAAMLPYFTEMYGNAASRQHEYGWAAEAAVEKARAQVAALIGARPEEVIFTSGATESINLALKGLAEASAPGRSHLITAVTEHRAVLDTCDRLDQAGYRVTRVPVDRSGLVDPEEIEKAITPETFGVSIMAANNEIGTVAPLDEIGAVCRKHGLPLHTDATQAAPVMPLEVDSMHIDLLSLSGHKMYGPKGIGALYVRAGVKLVPQMDGGGHERGLRSGTLDVPGIVGLGAAAALVLEQGKSDGDREATLRDRLTARLSEELDGVSVNGHPLRRLPNNASITFDGVRADRLLMDVRELAMSTGSACSSSLPGPSHVLKAIGLSAAQIASTVRLGLGRFTTEEEVTRAAELLCEGVSRAREHVARAGSARTSMHS